MSTMRWKLSTMFTDLIQYISQHLVEQTVGYYEDRLVTLLLLGSVGRGTPNQNSDIDMLLVAERLPRGRIKRIEEFNTVESKLESKLQIVKARGWNTYLSPVLKTPEEVSQGSLLFLDMVDDAKILLDGGEFFGTYRDRLRSHLAGYGAVKAEDLADPFGG